MAASIEITGRETATKDQTGLGERGDALPEPRPGWSWHGFLLWTGAILLLVLLVDGTRPWEDAILFSLLVITTGAGKRSIAFLSAIVLTRASEPTLQMPTYWFCLTPLAWAWRSASPSRRWAWEAFIVGVVMCWLGTPFIRDGLPANGLIPHLFGCCLFGVQWIGIALALRATRRLHPIVAALLAAVFATGCEVLQAVYGLPWIFMALALPAAPTPLAQWASWTTIFGVSFLLYLLNFLWLPDLKSSGMRRWLPPITAAAVAVLARVGGEIIANRVEIQPLAFSALIVQPYGIHESGEQDAAQTKGEDSLQALTEAALARESDVDLIIWPESARPEITVQESFPARPDALPSGRNRTTTSHDEIYRGLDARVGNASDLFRWPPGVRPRPLLLGVSAKAQEGTLYNSAYLVRPDGTLGRHDKLILVWLVERLPPLLDYSWFRTRVLPMFGVSAPMQPGTDYTELTLTNSNNRPVRLGVSICYEMYFPWLPQYRRSSDADAIVHLVNESWVKGDPALSKYETWTCQYRAIETRRWQVICTTMGNSAVIDPRGAIRQILAGRRGTLLAQPMQ